MADEDDGKARARQRIDALVAICEASLGGGSAPTRPRPRLIATLDLSSFATEGDGARVLASIPGRPARLTPLATEVLACDAEIVPVIFDGARPIAVGDARSPISSRLRTALAARDGGCRFPGCGAPVTWCDAHHVVPRGRGGPTAAANLLLLCRRCHRRVHRQGWRIAERPDGSFEFCLRGKTFLSAPFARPHRE